MRWSNKKHKIKKHKPTASSPAEFNRFTYANNNPLSGKDIDGNKWIPYGRFSGQPISPNRVDVLNNIYEMEAGIMRQEEKLKRAMALIDAEWRDFVTGGTPVIYVDGIKLSDTEADKLSQMGLSGLAWMFNASTIESYGITSIGSGSWINPAELFSDATSAGAWVRWDLAQSSEGNGSYTSTYVHPVTGQVATYTDNMPSVYVIESFVPAMDFGTGSLALGGGIGQGGGGGVYDIDKAINWLNSNAHESWKDAKGECAKYIRLALEAGGLSTKGHPVAAWEYSTFLPKLGFIKVNTTNYLKGDIAVIQGYSGGKSDPKTGIPYGHIQMYNGSIWISDFKQYNGFWPGRGYRDNQPPFEIFRWPTYR